MKIAPEILNIIPYKPGKPIEETQREYGLKEVYKLASNENLLGPSTAVKKAILENVEQIHRYPDGSCYLLKKSMCDHYPIKENQVIFGNGSDELIVLLMRAFCLSKDAILLSKGSFLLYSIFAQGCRLETTQVPLKKDYSIDLENMMKCWQPKHKLVFLPNPNNPTGSYVSKEQLKEFIRFFHSKEDTLTVIDEAYNVFVTKSDYPKSIEWLKEFPRLVILRTLSKDHGLAGLRIGFAIAHEQIIDILNRIRTPFNVNALAQAAARGALEDKEYVEKARKLNQEGLNYFQEELKKLQLPVYPSQGNFIFFDSLRDSSVLFEALLKKGLIIRPLKPYSFQTHFRMSVGCMDDNIAAINILKSVLPTVPIISNRVIT